MQNSKIDLDPEIRQDVIALLQSSLFDSLDLMLQTKNAHWNVRGRDFFMLHKLFDRIHEHVRELVDEFAERIGQLGGKAGSTVQEIAKNTRLPNYSDTTDSVEHLRSLGASIALVGREVRACIEKCQDLGDLATADLFTQTSRQLDEDLWFIEAHLQARVKQATRPEAA